MIYTFTVPSYHNDPALKEAFVKELRWHERQDKFLRGTYGQGDNGDFRGCAVGCSLHSLFRLGKTTEREWDRHDLFPKLIGVPEWLAHLADEIFEHSPEEYAMGFTVKLFDAIPVGVDLTLVTHTVMAVADARDLGGWRAVNDEAAWECVGDETIKILKSLEPRPIVEAQA